MFPSVPTMLLRTNLRILSHSPVLNSSILCSIDRILEFSRRNLRSRVFLISSLKGIWELWRRVLCRTILIFWSERRISGSNTRLAWLSVSCEFLTNCI